MLTLNKVGRRFGGLHALSEVSLQVEEFTVTSVIGPNGAGKTTMFNVISGLLKPTQGQVLFAGKNVTGYPPHRIAALGLTRTFQNIALFPSLNALETVMAAQYCRTSSGILHALFWLRHDRHERQRVLENAHKWLDWVGILDKRLLMPGELPYGDRRRLEIARSLATEPRLIMLDEPTAGMTGNEAQEIMTLVRRLADIGKTVLLIEHNMNVVMSISQHIIVLNFGEKIAEGAPSAIRNDPRVIEAYLGAEE